MTASSGFLRVISICIFSCHYNHIQSFEACYPSDGIAIGNTVTRIYDGFTFITRKEWNAKPWNYDICSCTINDTTEIIPLSSPYIITIHHTASPKQSFYLNESIKKVQDIQEFHQGPNRNWCDIAYNFLIDSGGNVFQGRPFWDDFNDSFVTPLNQTKKWPKPRLIQGSHSKHKNTNNIGVVVIGCYDTEKKYCPNGSDIIIRYDSTYTRLVQLVSFLCEYYDITPNNATIVRHKFWNVTHTECPGNILGSKKLFNDIITDVQMTINDGTPLCYDYSTNIQSDQNKTGGICKNSQLCGNNNLIIDTGKEDQCRDFGQVCCKIISNNNGNTSNKKNKDWGAIYIVISIISFVIILIIIAFILKKRKDWLLQQSDYADLAEKIKVDENGTTY